jgi:hypothetical protein
MHAGGAWGGGGACGTGALRPRASRVRCRLWQAARLPLALTEWLQGLGAASERPCEQPRAVVLDILRELTWLVVCAGYRLLTLPAVSLSAATLVLMAATQWLWKLAAEPLSVLHRGFVQPAAASTLTQHRRAACIC